MNIDFNSWTWRQSPRTASQTKREHPDSLELQQKSLPESLGPEALEYFSFCLSRSQQRSFLLDLLNRLQIPFRTIRTERTFHIVIFPQQTKGGREPLQNSAGEPYESKIFVASYSQKQIPENKNTAAWHLLNLAYQLQQSLYTVNTPLQLVLTDSENSYHLGEYYRTKYPGQKILFFIFSNSKEGELLSYLPSLLTATSLLKEQNTVHHELIRSEFPLLQTASAESQRYFSSNIGLNLWGYPALLYSPLPPQNSGSAERGTPPSFMHMHRTLSSFASI